MKQLIDQIKKIKKSDTGKLVKKRMIEFKEIEKKDVFNELCFCLLTANFNAERSIKMQKEIGNGFSSLSEEKLAGKLKELGHRFPNARAGFIFEARKHKGKLDEILEMKDSEAREWLAENITGLGYKEASHFLRNIGFENLAIIDFHIVDVLAKNRLIERLEKKDGRRPSVYHLSRKKYLEIEEVLKKIAEKAGLNLAELDLYLWFMETGKILK